MERGQFTFNFSAARKSPAVRISLGISDIAAVFAAAP